MAYKLDFDLSALNTAQIAVHSLWSHSKASEKYLDVTFKYPMDAFEFGLPIEYRRTGLDLATKDEIREYLPFAYKACNPDKWGTWKIDQKAFWDGKPKALITRPFFDILQRDFKWKCRSCELPKNDNPARRTQDIKEYGYTLATKTVRCTRSCGKKTTHLQLLPIPRLGVHGYETWSPELRDRIIKVLKRYDAFEGRKINSDSLLPDHKFSEIRWDHNTKRSSLEDITDQDIKRDFQLINNQRNQQKREACRACNKSGDRGFPLGIKFFYEGNARWPDDVPRRGKAAEKGCAGCGWYDLEKWRKSLIKRTSVIPS
jgi:hypothetical protein